MGPGPTGTGALGPAGGERLCPVSVACGDLLGEGPSEARQQAAQPRVHPVDRSVTDEDMCGQASPGATGGLVVTTSLLFVYPAGPHMIPPQTRLTLGVLATPAGHRCGGEATSESGPSCHGGRGRFDLLYFTDLPGYEDEAFANSSSFTLQKCARGCRGTFSVGLRHVAPPDMAVVVPSS